MKFLKTFLVAAGALFALATGSAHAEAPRDTVVGAGAAADAAGAAVRQIRADGVPFRLP